MKCGIFILMALLGTWQTLYGQPLNNRTIRRTCDFYEFNAAKLSFKLDDEDVLFYVDQVRSVKGLEGAKINYGNCKGDIEITFESGAEESIEHFLKQAFPEKPNHFGVTVDFRFELRENELGRTFWLLSTEYYAAINGSLVRIFYSDVISSIYSTSYLEETVSKLMKKSFRRLLSHNPHGVPLPFYENSTSHYTNFDAAGMDSVEVLRTWEEFELGTPVMHYPCKMTARGSEGLPWYELDSCVVGDYLPAEFIAAFIYQNDRYLNVGRNHFIKLNSLGNGYYLGRAETHLSADHAYFFGFMFGLVGLVTAAAVAHEKGNILVSSKGDVEFIKLKKLAQMFKSDKAVRQKLFRLKSNDQLTLDVKEAFLLEALRREGKIPPSVSD